MIIFMPAMHRSGSTHIAKSISAQIGGHYFSGMLHLETAWDDPHVLPIQQLQWHKVRLDNFVFVVHQHTLASRGTIAVMDLMGIEKVVVLTRKIKDVLLSTCVAHNNGAQMPNVHLTNDWHDWKSENQMNWLISNLSPWLFSFYSTWKQRYPNALFVNYAKHYEDEKAGNERILNYLGTPVDPTPIKLDDVENRIIAGEKPRWTNSMTIELHNRAKTWGPDLYEQMKEDGIV